MGIRCNKVVSCFFLIRSSTDRDRITKTVTFSSLRDFGFSMSLRDVYYRFYKISPKEFSYMYPEFNDALNHTCMLYEFNLMIFHEFNEALSPSHVCDFIFIS